MGMWQGVCVLVSLIVCIFIMCVNASMSPLVNVSLCMYITHGFHYRVYGTIFMPIYKYFHL